VKTKQQMRDTSLALAEWYSLCPSKSRKELLEDFSIWAHLFIWVGMIE
jgi:hypothetical protein